MMLDWLSPLLAGLATWRISNLLVNEDGPYNIFYHIRDKTGIRYRLEGEDAVVDEYPAWNPLHCVWCTSLWVAPVMFLLFRIAPWAVVMLSYSAITCLIEVWRSRDGKS